MPERESNSGSPIKHQEDLKEIITEAMKKVKGKKENDLCRYLPMPHGDGYIHHFTYRKMKSRQPQELGARIMEFILNAENPTTVSPKQRAARGSRKRRDQVTFTRTQLDRMLHMARLAGDKEMVSVLAPKKSLAICKRELISSIRHGRVDLELWNAYVEASNGLTAFSALA